MEFELANCNRFLDVAEFVLLAQRESPMLSVHRREQAPTQLKDYSPSVQALSEVNFITPFLLGRNNKEAEELSEFELEVQQGKDGAELYRCPQQPEQSGQSDADSDDSMVQPLNMLDAIEQECEKQLSLASTMRCSPQEQPSVLASINENTIVDQQAAMNPYGSTNGYNWLTYRQNNIETLESYANACHEYMRENRRTKVQRYLYKRTMRNWGKKVSYTCRKEVADARLRVKGRFITRVQASELLGIETDSMPLDEVKSLLELKLGSTKELSETGESERK